MTDSSKLFRASCRLAPRWRTSDRTAVTLVELLVAVSILGVLLGLLMPAIQAARESASSADCKNRLRQLGQSFQGKLGGMTAGGGIAAPENLSRFFSTCPSAGSAETINWKGLRIPPTNYLRVFSGTAVNEHEPMHHMNGFFSFLVAMDVMKVNNGDGTAYTAAIGDALYDLTVVSADGTDVVDHWNWWELPEYSIRYEHSHTYGSTGVPINALKRDDVDFDAKELSFGSRHPSGINVVFVDGHVAFIRQSIAADVWSGLGTVAGGEPIFDYQ